MNKPHITRGPITVTLTEQERMIVSAAVATFAQQVAHALPEHAETAWCLLDKVVDCENARALFGASPPTRAEIAKLVVDCEFQAALQRTRSGS